MCSFFRMLCLEAVTDPLMPYIRKRLSPLFVASRPCFSAGSGWLFSKTFFLAHSSCSAVHSTLSLCKTEVIETTAQGKLDTILFKWGMKIGTDLCSWWWIDQWEAKGNSHLFGEPLRFLVFIKGKGIWNKNPLKWHKRQVNKRIQ